MVKYPSLDWQEVACRKQADREFQMQKHAEWRNKAHPDGDSSDVSQLPLKKLTDKERTIVHCDATSLADLIRKRVYTSVEVLTAFAKAAIAAQDCTNCLTEIFIDEALDRAQELDKYLEDTGKVVGPLHGQHFFPIWFSSYQSAFRSPGVDQRSHPPQIQGYFLWVYWSVKVSGGTTINLMNFLCSTAWAYNTKAEKDAVVVDILRKAGAVLYVKTQNPQSLLVRRILFNKTLICIDVTFQSLETNNNIYGRVSNPFNTNLTSGGSSGGESALIASHGSPLGVGTDIGGSIVSKFSTLRTLVTTLNAPSGYQRDIAVCMVSKAL